MKAGDLSRLYSVRGREESRDSRGERSRTYTHKFDIWAETPREGSVQIAQEVGATRSEQTMRLRARYRRDVVVGDRLVDKSTLEEYYITGVFDVDGSRKWMQLVVTQSPALGA